jgi:hypothetical protein
VSKRSRRPGRNTPPRQLPPPQLVSDHPPSDPEAERLLLDQIAAGELDVHLSAIADAITPAWNCWRRVNSAKVLAMLNVGDRVRFTHRIRPQYLQGVEGVVIEIDQRTATVCVHQPLGRFGCGQIRRCPPLLLERLHPAA